MPGISHAATALRDPLAIVLALFILGGLASHLLFRKYPVGRAAVRVVFLILLTVAFVHAGIVPYHPTRLTGNTLHDAVHGVLKIAWWLWAAWFLVALVRALIVSERRPHQDKLIQDLLAGVIYLAAVFAIIAYVLDLPVRGLLATSGAIAIVLGLALQSTLSDLFSGIVLDMCRPYRPGDWISIEGGTDGRVIETNWRATHVLTAKRDLAIVPNSTIAKAKIINVSSPSGIHGVTVTIQLESDAPPSSGKEILEDAVLNCRLIVRSPAPTVTIKSMNGAFTEFDIAFFVEDLAQSANAQNKLFDCIFRHLFLSDVRLASPQDQSGGDRQGPRQPLPEAERLLALVPIFDTLTTDERKPIAPKLKLAVYDRDETLVEPGRVLNALFLIGRGVLSATAIEGETELERFGPGDHYGEIGMLTGSPSIAKIAALTPVVVYELAKDDLTPIFEAFPRVAEKLSCALAQRQAASRLGAETGLEETLPTNALAAWFSERLHRLYGVASAAQ